MSQYLDTPMIIHLQSRTYICYRTLSLLAESPTALVVESQHLVLDSF